MSCFTPMESVPLEFSLLPNYGETTDEFSVKEDVEKFLRRVQLKAFFHDKEDDDNETFETLQIRKTK